MSFQVPNATVTTNQFITNSLGQRIELRLHDNRLYLMSHVGNSTVGGELILDPLPVSATHGTDGDSVNPVVSVSFNTDLSTMSDEQLTELMAYAKELTGADEVVLLGTEAGSLIINLDCVFAVGTDTTAALAATQDEAAVRSGVGALSEWSGVTLNSVTSSVSNKQVNPSVLSFTFTPGATGTDPSATETITIPTHPGSKAGNYFWNMVVSPTSGDVYFSTRTANGSHDIQVFKRSPSGVIETIAALPSTNSLEWNSDWMYCDSNGDLYIHMGESNYARVYKFPQGTGPAQILFDMSGGSSTQRAFNWSAYVYEGYIYYYKSSSGPLRRKLLSSFTGTAWGYSDVDGEQITCDTTTIGQAENEGILAGHWKWITIYDSKIYWKGQRPPGNWQDANPVGWKLYRANLDGSNVELMWDMGPNYDESDRDAVGNTGVLANYRMPSQGYEWIKVNSSGLYKFNHHGMDHWPFGSNVRQEAIPFKHSSIYDIDGSGTNYNRLWLFVDWYGATMYIVADERSNYNQTDFPFLTWPQFGPATVGDFKTVGPYQTMQFKLSTDTSYTTIAPGATTNIAPADPTNFDLDVRLLNNSGDVLVEKTITYTS